MALPTRAPPGAARAAPAAADLAPVGKLPEEVTTLGFDAGTLYAGTAAGVYRSRDGGASWAKVRPPPKRPPPPSRFTFANGSVFVEGGRVDVLQPGDAWSHRDDCWAILPAATGFWLRLSNGFARVRTLGDKPEPLVWPDNPLPTVEAVGAHFRWSSMVISLPVPSAESGQDVAAQDRGRT